MSGKTKKIVSIILLAIPSAMVLLSGVMKLSHSEQVVTGLSKIGYGSLISALGAAEIVFVVLLWIPQTWKIGFLLLLSYLGGAAAIEVMGGKGLAFIFIALLWAGVSFKENSMFTTSAAK